MEDKKEMLFCAARQLFSQKGYKDTNIPEITSLAGVAVGTFYNYFDSKDAIFFEVFTRENEDVKREVLSSVNLEDDPLVTMTRMMLRGRDTIASNRILQEWYNKDLYNKMEKKFLEDKSNERMNELLQTWMSEFIRKWQAEGKIRSDLDVGMILALFNSTIYVDMHKTEIGLQYFPQIVYFMIEFIIKGITDIPEQTPPHAIDSSNR